MSPTDPLARFPEAMRPRILAARIAAKPLAKTSRNAEFGYAYASSDSIVAEAREILGAVEVGFGFRLVSWRLLGSDLLDSATGAGVATVEVDLVAPDAACTESIEWPIIIGRRNAGGPLRPLDKALSGAFTTAQGILMRGILGLDRSDPAETLDGRDEGGTPKPVREARRDTAQRQQQRKPEPQKPVAQSAPHEDPPPPSSPPGDLDPSRGAPDPSLDAGTERLARRARNITIGKLILAVGGRDAAGPIVGFAPDQIDELKLAPQDVQERAIAALELALELGRTTVPLAVEPPKGPPEGSPEYYAARAAMKGSQTHG